MSNHPARKEQLVRVVPRRVSHQQLMLDLRNQLPTPQYLSLLHTLALTGQMPCFDPAPPNDPYAPLKPNGTYTPPDRQLQHKTLLFLVDKAFTPIEKPAASKLDNRPDDAVLLENAREARTLTVGELIRRLTAPVPAPDTATPVPTPDTPDAYPAKPTVPKHPGPRKPAARRAQLQEPAPAASPA